MFGWDVFEGCEGCGWRGCGGGDGVGGGLGRRKGERLDGTGRGRALGWGGGVYMGGVALMGGVRDGNWGDWGWAGVGKGGVM